MWAEKLKSVQLTKFHILCFTRGSWFGKVLTRIATVCVFMKQTLQIKIKSRSCFQHKCFFWPRVFFHLNWNSSIQKEFLHISKTFKINQEGCSLVWYLLSCCEEGAAEQRQTKCNDFTAQLFGVMPSIFSLSSSVFSQLGNVYKRCQFHLFTFYYSHNARWRFFPFD